MDVTFFSPSHAFLGFFWHCTLQLKARESKAIFPPIVHRAPDGVTMPQGEACLMPHAERWETGE